MEVTIHQICRKRENNENRIECRLTQNILLEREKMTKTKHV